MLVVTSGLVTAVEVSALVIGVEGASVLENPISGSPVLVMAVVGVFVLVAVVMVVISKLVTAVEVGRISGLVMAVLVVGVPVPVTEVAGVSVSLLAVWDQNCISVSRSVSQRYPESPATVNGLIAAAPPASPLSLDLAELIQSDAYLSSTKDSATLQLMHIVSSFGFRGRGLAVGVGSVEMSGLAEAELELDLAVAVGSSIAGRRGDEGRDDEGRDVDEVVGGS